MADRRVQCREKCRGGQPCRCMRLYGTPHTQHICTNPQCACHTPAAYGLVSVTVRGRALYVRAGRAR